MGSNLISIAGFPGVNELSDEIRTAIYRVVQEGTDERRQGTRVQRHASAWSLSERRGTLRLMIEDDGAGLLTPRRN